MIRALLCRLTGWGCTPSDPSHRDLVRELRARGRVAEAESVELRRRRVALDREQALLDLWGPGPHGRGDGRGR